MRRLSTSAVLAFIAVLVLAASASAQESMTLTADLNELNGSGASADATLTLEGNQLTVDIQGSGFAPGSLTRNTSTA